MQVFIHTVGTSILTNMVREGFITHEALTSKYLNQMTTLSANELDPNQHQILTLFKQTDISQLSVEKMSAELKTLSHYRQKYASLISDHSDIHYLIHTDTATGKVASDLLQKMMQNMGMIQIQPICIPNLNTRNTQEFQQGIKNLFSWLTDNLSAYQESNTPIIFNLTGGFKSLQGYMNTAGMFYADRIIYIFESGQDLVEIPKLPISLDKNSIEKYATEFLTTSVMGYVSNDYLQQIADVYKEGEDGLATLSAIGVLAWSQYERQLLETKLLKFPHLHYEDSFLDDFKNRPRDKVKLQKTLAKVSFLLSENNGDVRVLKDDNGLRYENYAEDRTIGHFRVNQETRVSCRVQGQNLLLLHFGEHDYVNL